VKLDAIAVHLVTLDLQVPFTTSFGTFSTLIRPFVVLKTTDGALGVGEIPTLPVPAYKPEADTPAVMTSLQEFILPSVREYHHEHGGIASIDALRASYAWIKGATFAKSGVEAAAWDLTAQAANAPLWQLWGGSRREIDVGVSIGGRTIAEVVERADAAVAQAYPRLKVKIWPGFDLDVVRAIRERHPTIQLQVDANSAYDLSNWTPLKALDQFELLLIEQPLFDDDIVMHAEISREIATPICLDESIHSSRDAEAAINLWGQHDRLDRLIINIKPPRVGGFTEAIAIARTCRKHGVRTWIGGMLDSAWGKASNLHLNALTEIDLPGDHFSPVGPYFIEDVTETPLTAVNGRFTLTDAASTGITLDPDRLERMGARVFEMQLND
jgi:O-succinylbenzoate synthase